MINNYIDGYLFYDLGKDIDRRLSKRIGISDIQIGNAVNVSICIINEMKALLFEINKLYKMGTIGVVEGEKISLAFEYAIKAKLPVIAIVASGGMRVNEGTLALMQMAKLTAVVKQHSDKGLLYIAVVTEPTLGGASASFVSLADIIVAERGAIYGFSGRRIIEDTTHEQLPDDFQTAEYAKLHGMIDIVADKAEIKSLITNLLRMHTR